MDKALRERIEKARKVVGKLASDGCRSWRMSVPPEADDTDFLLDSALKDARDTIDTLAAELDRLREEVERLSKDAERYSYLRKGDQWIIAVTQTDCQVDGEKLDALIDSEIMEQQK